MAELQPRKRPTFPDLDYSKPVDTEAIEATASETDCFTFLFEAGCKECVLCNDNLICSIMFNYKQTLKIKQHEKSSGHYLDNIHFDSINREDVRVWILHKPRTLKEFEKLIKKHSECPDARTVHFFCTSFLKEYMFKIVDGIICLK